MKFLRALGWVLGVGAVIALSFVLVAIGILIMEG